MLVPLILDAVVDVGNVSTGQAIGLSGALLVVGAVVGYLIKYLPIINEEHKKYKSGVIDGWRGFVERQTLEIESLHKKMEEERFRNDRKFAEQEERYLKCQETASQLRAELTSLKNEMARLENSTHSNSPIMLTAAEIVFAPNGDIRSASDGLHPLLGYVPADLIGKKVEDLLSPSDKQYFMDKIVSLEIDTEHKERALIFTQKIPHKKRHRDKVDCQLVLTKGTKAGEVLYRLLLNLRKDFFDQ